MAARRADGTKARLAQLWQLPLLAVSLGLFGVAGYLLIRPKTVQLTLDQKIDRAASLLGAGRADAASEELRALREAGVPLTKPQDARIHLLQADALESVQKSKHLDGPADHKAVIDHLKQAVTSGAPADGATYRRLGEHYEALGRTTDALENYGRAMPLDPAATALRRKVIELQLAKGDDAAAEQELGPYLKDEHLRRVDRVWAMRELSRLRTDRADYAGAKAILADALKLGGDDPIVRGQVYYGLGYCEWKLGNLPEAEGQLRAAQQQFAGRSPLDGEAAYLLGQIHQNRGDAKTAVSFYTSVLTNYPGLDVAPLARLGRGACRAEVGEDDAGIDDLRDTVHEIQNKPSRAKLIGDAVGGLVRAADRLAGRGNLRGALELMTLEHDLVPEPPPTFFARLGEVQEKVAAQAQSAAAAATDEPARAARRDEANKALVTAGDAWQSNARAITVADDAASGDALLRAVDLYDRGGDVNRMAAALQRFVDDRPNDPRTPDAMLRLGAAYQAAGLFDRAIAAFQQNQLRYPQNLAASKSGVPLARAYLAKGPEFFGKAERALQSTLESPLITPAAEDFKDALFELARLYYRTDRYEEAVARLEELTERYPKEERSAEALFLMADSYRKSATLLKANATDARAADTTATTRPAAVAARATPGEAAAARRERLEKARRLYDRVIDQFKDAAPSRDLDPLYLKLSYFYRADCLYDSGSYEEAIRLYDAAAVRYQNDSAALAASVQIVNAYLALGRPADAKAANERAKWLLRRMPPEAFKDGQLAMPRKYWEDWLAWSSSAGLW